MKKTTWADRILLSGFCMLAVYGLSWAQGLPVKLGNKVDKYPSSNAMYFNTTLKQGYSVVTGTSTVRPMKDYIEYKDAPIAMKAEFLANAKNAFLNGSYTVGSKNYLIYSIADENKDELVVYSQEMSAKMALLGSPLVIARFNVEIKKNFYSSGILIEKSSSGKQIIIYRNWDEDAEEHVMDVAAFHTEKGPMWSKRFDMDPELGYDTRVARVSESGNVYFSGFYKKKDTKKSRFLLAYSPKKDLQKMHTVPVVKKGQDAPYTIRFLADGTPLWVGLYENRDADQSGYRLQRVDSVTLEVTTLVENPFTEAFNEVIRKEKNELGDYYIKDLLDMGNGDIVLTIEGYTGYSGNNVASAHTTPVYVVRADKQGKEKWTTVIQKSQWQYNGSWMTGHFLFYRGDKVYLIYNDTPEDASASPTEKQTEDVLKKKVYVAQVEINKAGKSTRTGLLPQDKNEYSSFAMGDMKRIDDHQYQCLFKLADGYQFALIRVNE